MVEIPKEPIKLVIESFNPSEAQHLNILSEYNNLYHSLIVQQEQHRVAMNNIQELRKIMVKHFKEREGKTYHPIYLPMGNGGMRPVYKDDMPWFLGEIDKQYKQMETQYLAIIAQRERRGDELGESRVRAFKTLGDLLRKQHKFQDKELLELLTEKIVPVELPTVLEEMKQQGIPIEQPTKDVKDARSNPS